jgi:hypothetical protein
VNYYEKKEEYQKKIHQLEQSSADQKDQLLVRILRFYNTDTPSGRENRRKNWEILQTSVDHNRQLPTLARIELTDTDQFRSLDTFFFTNFMLDQYIAFKEFSYPIIFCETLEEFAGALLSREKLSKTERQRAIGSIAEKIKYDLSNRKGSILGVDISGVACYLNGWVFGKMFNLNPAEILKVPEYFGIVAETAVHEKIGHGFLSLFSPLGRVINDLGLRNVHEAEQFEMEVNTNPLHTLRQKKYETLLASSCLQQEGWATWIESFYSRHYFRRNEHPKYQFDKLKYSIEALKVKNEGERMLKKQLCGAFDALFDENDYSPEGLLLLLSVFKQAEIVFKEQFILHLGQPLKYALGQLLMYQIEINAGFQCVPHAALLAGNICLDIDLLSLQDMIDLLNSDPRLNADTRLAMISKIKLKTTNDVAELARRCEEDLSMPIPIVYKQSR